MKKALIVVDVQNDFCKDGSLEVPNANEIIPIINKLTKNKKFDFIIFTKDWHPSNHKSFASNYPGNHKMFDVVDLNGLKQVLWPDHCIQDTNGSEIHKDINLDVKNMYIFKKGINPELDSYSAFYENDGKTDTGLSKFLKDKNVEETYIVGLSMDFCAKFTAIDSVKDGFKTFFIRDASRSISDNILPTLNELGNSGVNIILSKDI